MSEWLTTTQMLDQLKEDEVAETFDVNGNLYATVKKDHIGNFERFDEDGFSEGVLRLNKVMFNRYWRILPKYVSIEEAMKALKEGKVVTLETPYTTHSFSKENYFKAFVDKSISIAEFADGKWIIED